MAVDMAGASGGDGDANVAEGKGARLVETLFFVDPGVELFIAVGVAGSGSNGGFNGGGRPDSGGLGGSGGGGASDSTWLWIILFCHCISICGLCVLEIVG